MKRFTIILCVSFFLFSSLTEAKSSSKIAIILDDVGGKPNDEVLFELPKQITFSILPNTRFSTKFSYKAASQNREVMLHMPMEPLNDKALGAGPLLANMNSWQLRTTLHSALKTVPHAVGVNNHMGSKLTQMTMPMQTIMSSLADNNLFFIDSMTTRYSMAGTIAQQSGVSNARRHVFLDHVQTEAFIAQQFAALITRAREEGKAIAIAHPYPSTIAFLSKTLKALPSDIEIITVSEYLKETDKFRINPLLTNTANNTADIAPSVDIAPQ